MKRATLAEIQQCRLKIISTGGVPSATSIARELGAAFSPASIVLGLRQLESREVRRPHLPERNQLAPPAEEASRNQVMRDRLSITEKLLAELRERIGILERRERALNRGYTKAERKLAKSRYRNRDYKSAMSKLSAEIVALEASLKQAGERWRPAHLTIPDFAQARLRDDNKARLIALRYSLPNGNTSNSRSPGPSESMFTAHESLSSRLLSALSIQEQHKHLMYNAMHSYHLENRRLLDTISGLERKVLVLTQNQQRTNGAFSHLWPPELLKST